VSDPAREITQRELRNDSGAILRAVEDGATFVVTRNGSPVAELRPLRRRTFVPTSTLATLFPKTGRIDREEFFADIDRLVDQEPPSA
jgi:prevent-host-death family protein